MNLKLCLIYNSEPGACSRVILYSLHPSHISLNNIVQFCLVLNLI